MTKPQQNRPKWYADFNSLFRSYMRVAKRRGVSWELDTSQFATITKNSCYLCGRKPHRIHRHSGINSPSNGYEYNGIDRLDNTIGYTVKNSYPCCFDCNRMKSDLDFKHFKKHLIRILKVIL